MGGLGLSASKNATPGLLLGKHQRRQGLPFGDENHGDGIHTVAQVGGWRPVFEDMAEMATAASAVHFGSWHEQFAIDSCADVVRGNGFKKGRPAGAAVELRLGDEEDVVATGADVGAGLGDCEASALEGGLGSLLAQDVVLGGSQAFCPFRRGEIDRPSRVAGLRIV